MAQNEELFYDDEDAVKYIRKNLEAELSKNISDDMGQSITHAFLSFAEEA